METTAVIKTVAGFPLTTCSDTPPPAGSSLRISQATARPGDVFTFSVSGTVGETAAVAFSRTNSGVSFRGESLLLGADLGILFTCQLSSVGSCSQSFSIPSAISGTFFFQAGRSSDPTFRAETFSVTNGACLTVQGPAVAFELQSPGFSPDAAIPVRHTCDGPDLSPPLRWTEPPPNTREFALILDDPDAPGGTFVHWVLYGVPATVRELPEGVPPQAAVPGIGTQGMNDFGNVGYGGPCPPPGPAHRYSIRLYALDTPLALAPRMTQAQLLQSIEGHVLGQADLVGRYMR